MNARLLSTAAAAALLAAALPAAAHSLVFTAQLSGAAEGNSSPATGLATVTLDEHTLTAKIDATFSGLLTPTVMSHIHCCTAAPASAPIVLPFFDFPTGVTSGSYSSTLDLSQSFAWSASFLQANGNNPAQALSALIDGIGAGKAYFNIHTSGLPAGEIRGYLTPAVPEPSTYALTLGGLAVASIAARRRLLRASGSSGGKA